MTDGTYSGLDDAAILDRLVPDRCAGTAGTADADDRDRTDVAKPSVVRAGVELRVRLSTLLGHDEAPGELAGWGPVHAEMARDLTATLADARWWFAITDDTGHLLHTGITRARPAGTRRTGRSRNLVELQVPLSSLRALADHDTGPWSGVITDLLRRSTTSADHSGTSTAGSPEPRYAGTCRSGGRCASSRRAGPPPPGRTWTTRSTTPAVGATAEVNLGGTCTHDHQLKHDGGWHLRQPRPGHFVWTSRLGHHYPSRPPPIIEPLPDPMPRNEPPRRPPIIIDDDTDDGIRPYSPYPPAPLAPPPAPDAGPDEPPF